MITASLALRPAPPKCTSARDRTLLETRHQFQLSKLVHQGQKLPTNHVCSAMRDIDSSATARHVGTLVQPYYCGRSLGIYHCTKNCCASIINLDLLDSHTLLNRRTFSLVPLLSLSHTPTLTTSSRQLYC